jgi:hypothetical protein
VLEKYTVTPLTWELPSKLPLYLHPPKIPAVEGFKPKVEPGKDFNIEPKIPAIEEFKPDVKPAEYKPVQFQPIVPKIGDITAVAPRVSEVTAPRIGEAVQPRVEPHAEPKISDIAVTKIVPKTMPRLEPRLDVPPPPPPPPPPPEKILPKLPGLPPLGFGTRDIPVPRELRLYGRKEWLVRWFGPGAPEVITAARPRRARRRGGRRR